MTSKTLSELFKFLEVVGYQWLPITPDQHLIYRKQNSFMSTQRLLGLGQSVLIKDLLHESFGESLIQVLLEEGIFNKTDETHIKSSISISRNGDQFILYDHWPPAADRASEYVHYGPESVTLSRLLQDNLEAFIGKNILDLGCSSGALSFEILGVANKVIGIDSSVRAIDFAKVTAQAFHYSNIQFHSERIGTPRANALCSDSSMDGAVFNPPMVIPRVNSHYPHRDGGAFGIEVPLLFLDYSLQKLKTGAEIFCLMTNPIVNGKSLLLDELRKRKLTILKQKCIRSMFNQSVIDEMKKVVPDLQKTELWYFNFVKK